MADLTTKLAPARAKEVSLWSWVRLQPWRCDQSARQGSEWRVRDAADPGIREPMENGGNPVNRGRRIYALGIPVCSFSST